MFFIHSGLYSYCPPDNASTVHKYFHLLFTEFFKFVPHIFQMVIQVQTSFLSGIDPVLIPALEARQVANFVSQNTQQRDLVIGSPAMIWQFDNRVADFQVTLAAEGQETHHFPENIPDDRFEYDPRLSQAQLVVVDRIWHNWGAINISGVAEIISEVERWPLVFQTSEIKVYQHP